MIRHAVISLAMFAVAAVAAEPAVARARPSEPAVVGVRGNEETTFSSVGSSRVRIEEEPLGLVPCDAPPAPPGCFILRTPFPPKGVRGAEACELKWPGLTVLLDDVELPILDSHFDGADVTFDVDIRAALKYAGVKAGDSRALRAIATLRCPTDTFEDAAEELPDNRVLRVGDADGRLIFPFNFFLLEEITYLADSIETLVEAADNLEITVDGTDGSEEFLYGGSGGGGGPHAYELDPRDEDTDGAGPAFTDDPEPAERPEFDLPEFDPPYVPLGRGTHRVNRTLQDINAATGVSLVKTIVLYYRSVIAYAKMSLTPLANLLSLVLTFGDPSAGASAMYDLNGVRRSRMAWPSGLDRW